MIRNIILLCIALTASVPCFADQAPSNQIAVLSSETKKDLVFEYLERIEVLNKLHQLFFGEFLHFSFRYKGENIPYSSHYFKLFEFVNLKEKSLEIRTRSYMQARASADTVIKRILVELMGIENLDLIQPLIDGSYRCYCYEELNIEGKFLEFRGFFEQIFDSEYAEYLAFIKENENVFEIANKNFFEANFAIIDTKYSEHTDENGESFTVRTDVINDNFSVKETETALTCRKIKEKEHFAKLIKTTKINSMDDLNAYYRRLSSGITN